MPRDTRIYRPVRKTHYGLIALLGTFAIGVGAAGILFAGSGGNEPGPSAVASAPTAAKVVTVLPSGPMRAGNVEVVKPTLDLGRQPLNVTVQPAFELKNVGAEQVLLGEASIEVLEGCCPQTPIMGSLSIQPGSTTTVSVPMMMHKGMDGPHLFHVTVPVQGTTSSAEALHLYVKADFR